MKTTTPQAPVKPAAVMLDYSEMRLIIAFRQMPERQQGQMLNFMEDVAHAFGNPNPVMSAGGAK